MVTAAVVGIAIVAGLLPPHGKFGLRAVVATVFLISGELLLMAGVTGEFVILVTCLVSGGLLLLVEIGVGRRSAAVLLLWIAVGAVHFWMLQTIQTWVSTARPWAIAASASGGILLGTFAVLRRRAANRPRFDPSDLTGI
jgi:hypothetical protein